MRPRRLCGSRRRGDSGKNDLLRPEERDARARALAEARKQAVIDAQLAEEQRALWKPSVQPRLRHRRPMHRRLLHLKRLRPLLLLLPLPAAPGP